MKKGQSEIITIVLIILMILAAIIIVWNVVYSTIKNSSQQVNIDIFSNKIQVIDIILGDSIAEVKVKKTQGEDNITSLKFIFYDSQGLTKTMDKTENIPSILEEKTFYFDIQEIKTNEDEIVKVEVIPYFGNTPGMKASSDENIQDVGELFPGVSGEITIIDTETGEKVIEPSIDAWKVVYGNLLELETSTDTYSGEGYSVSMTGNIQMISNKLIEIDSEKTYYQEAWFKSNQQSPLYFGYALYDEFYRLIKFQNVAYKEGSETYLVAPCSASDTTIKINNGSKWIFSLPYYYAAFNIDDSGDYNDLPNFNLSNGNILNVVNKGTYWEVTFGSNVGINAPANTKVREHVAGNDYVYNSAKHSYVPVEWTKYSSEVKGYQEEGIPNNLEDLTKWRKGTKYAGLLVLGNYGYNLNNITLIDDIKVIEK
jgi:hypothetical protein